MLEIGGWGWFWIWIFLGATALVIFGLLAKYLLNKFLEVAHQISRLVEKTDALISISRQKLKVENPEPSLKKDSKIEVSKRRALLKAKQKKKEQRQRRLIASLKKFDPNESRFR